MHRGWFVLQLPRRWLSCTSLHTRAGNDHDFHDYEWPRIWELHSTPQSRIGWSKWANKNKKVPQMIKIPRIWKFHRRAQSGGLPPWQRNLPNQREGCSSIPGQNHCHHCHHHHHHHHHHCHLHHHDHYEHHHQFTEPTQRPWPIAQ